MKSARMDFMGLHQLKFEVGCCRSRKFFLSGRKQFAYRRLFVKGCLNPLCVIYSHFSSSNVAGAVVHISLLNLVDLVLIYDVR